MIRTVELGGWQFRYDWTGAALFFGRDHLWTIQAHWWRYPRLVIRHDHATFSFPNWYRRSA